MGLDQYLKSRLEIDETIPESERPDPDITDLAYWRKHPGLQGYMAALWRERKPDSETEDFNCTELPLSHDDLLAWQQVALDWSYPETSGFFFGHMDEERYYQANDLDAIAKALKAVADGRIVYYDSWW